MLFIFSVLNGHEIWSLILLRVLDIKVLGIMLGRKAEKVTGGWRKLHNVELHTFYSSQA
jgi:hypothetical protein